MIAGINICRVGIVDRVISAKMLALNKLLFRVSKAATSAVIITKT